MKNIKRQCIAALMLVAASGVWASGLDSICVRIASESAPVRAEAARFDIEKLQGEIDNTLPGPDVDFDYKFGTAGDNRWGLSVGQSFDWPGVYGARREANSYRKTAFAELHRQNIIDKALELQLAAIRLSQARNNLGILTAAAENFKQLNDFVDNAFKRGEATIIALRKTELELMGVQTTLAKAESELVAAEAAVEAIMPGCLANFYNLNEIEIVALRSEQDYIDDFNRSSAMSGRELISKSAYKDIDVARRSALPSFKLSYIHDFEDSRHFNGFSVGMSLPSWSPSKTKRLAEARALATELDSYDYKIISKARIHADYVEADRLYSRISDQAKIIGGDYPELLKKAFDSGGMTIFVYLTEYNNFLDIFVQHNELMAQYAQLQARLAKNSMITGIGQE